MCCVFCAIYPYTASTACCPAPVASIVGFQLCMWHHTRPEVGGSESVCGCMHAQLALLSGCIVLLESCLHCSWLAVFCSLLCCRFELSLALQTSSCWVQHFLAARIADARSVLHVVLQQHALLLSRLPCCLQCCVLQGTGVAVLNWHAVSRCDSRHPVELLLPGFVARTCSFVGVTVGCMCLFCLRIPPGRALRAIDRQCIEVLQHTTVGAPAACCTSVPLWH